MLHTVNKSPFERNSLATCVANIADDGAILLIEDGVLGATNSTKSSLIADLASQGRIFALGADLEARGVANKVMAGVQLVDYKGFVELTTKHNACASWL